MPASQQISAVVWGLSVGITMVVIIWAVIRGGWFRKPTNDVLPADDATPDPIGPVHDYPEGLAEAHGPVPLIVKLIIISVLVWTVVYIGLFARAGFTFS
jgi:hypothetical protein